MKSINSEKSLTEPSLSLTRYNEILAEASKIVKKFPGIRFGQAMIYVMTPDDYNRPWEELFYTEDPEKAKELLFSKVEV